MNTRSIDIKENIIELFEYLRKRILWILLSGTIFGMLVCGAYYYFIPDEYQAAIKIQSGMQVSNDFTRLINSRPILEQVIYEAGADMTPEELDSEFFITIVGDSRVMEMEINDYDSKQAVTLVRAFLKVAKAEYGNIFNLKVVEDTGEAYPLPKEYAGSFARSFLVGAIFSAVIISIKYLRSSKIHKAEEITDFLHIPILAVLPRWDIHKTKVGRIRHEN